MHMYGIWSAPFSCLPLQHTLCVDPCTAISVIGTDLQPWPCSLHIVNALWKCCQSSCKHLLFINSCHTHTHMQTHAFPHHCSPPTHTQTHTHTDTHTNAPVSGSACSAALASCTRCSLCASLRAAVVNSSRRLRTSRLSPAPCTHAHTQACI
jgi:hypothetical protein